MTRAVSRILFIMATNLKMLPNLQNEHFVTVNIQVLVPFNMYSFITIQKTKYLLKNLNRLLIPVIAGRQFCSQV